MPMTEFPRFAMDDSAAVAGNVPANLAICCAFPSAFRSQTKPAITAAPESVPLLKIIERVIARARLRRADEDVKSSRFHHPLRPPRPRMGGNQRSRAA